MPHTTGEWNRFPGDAGHKMRLFIVVPTRVSALCVLRAFLRAADEGMPNRAMIGVEVCAGDRP